MIAANLVAYESGPKWFAISENTPKAAEPDNERTIINGNTSTGTDNLFSIGDRILPHISIAPEALNIDIATSIATRYGMMFIATVNPSFAPSVNASYIGTFLINPKVNMTTRIIGKIHNE